MKEILPGVHHWTARHPKIHIDVSSYYLAEEKVLIDPLLPAEGLDPFARGVDHIFLTNRHHYRQSDAFVRRFGCTVWCSAPGMHEFTHGEKVTAFNFGDTLPGGIEAIEIGELCPDETALFVAREGGLLAVADGVVRTGSGPLRFVEDDYIRDDPSEVPAVKAGLRRAYARVLNRTFDTLLMAHGLPMVGGARAALRMFTEAS
jgi:hypothetical protein